MGVFTMDELVKLVLTKTQLDEATAQRVVTIVVDELKAKLPKAAASQIDAVLAGERPQQASGFMALLSGLFKRRA